MAQSYDIIHPTFLKKKDLSPIIFLHGLLETKHSWKIVCPLIVQKTGRKAYVLDARNHGESFRSETMDFDVLTQDLLDFVNEHNIERAVIVGHSCGGRTAINFALKHPERTEALVVEEMTPKNIGSNFKSFLRNGLDMVLEYMSSMPPEWDIITAKDEVVKRVTHYAKELHMIKDIEKILEHWDWDFVAITKVENSFTTICNLDAVISMLENNALVQDLTEKNLVYDGDALFLYGDLGFYNLGRDHSIKKLFPRAIVKKIPDACHCIHFESPNEFAEIVSHFIQRRNFHEAKL